MKGVTARITGALQVGSRVPTCDNSGAREIKIIAVKTKKTRKGRRSEAGIADLVIGSVTKGKTEMKGQIVEAVVVRQRKEYRRPNGMRVKFEDNAVVILKDEFGNPKGTIFKGPIAKEVAERWPGIAKVATMIL
ncbi:50S ribosomal protein L14 [Candidatus Woesearchaeota archaeon]|nr:50S ribosomal protein L14 [Candidatus Woesearchaeota archaeon]